MYEEETIAHRLPLTRRASWLYLFPFFKSWAGGTRGIYLKRSRGLVFLSDSHVNRNGAYERATGKGGYF
ncbi:unnamed protein product [Larinioides sclopetarius]|uniref:Metallophosphoesterase n=1 Tax=Larinioides sclopetarius TaxID=280406 RepID=A0AAV2AJP6_9ARAC